MSDPKFDARAIATSAENLRTRLESTQRAGSTLFEQQLPSILGDMILLLGALARQMDRKPPKDGPLARMARADNPPHGPTELISELSVDGEAPQVKVRRHRRSGGFIVSVLFPPGFEPMDPVEHRTEDGGIGYEIKSYGYSDAG